MRRIIPKTGGHGWRGRERGRTVKPLIGIILAILALPFFILFGAFAGVRDCMQTIWRLGDDFYYTSKVRYWGKYTPADSEI